MFALGSGVDVDENKARGFFGLADAAGYDWQGMARSLGVDIDELSPA
jgi:hypothetical protein